MPSPAAFEGDRVGKMGESMHSTPTPTSDMGPAILTTTRLPGAGVELEATVGGPEDGPLVILLHGFPDAWRTWDRQVEPLIGAGYRVVLPSMRGYGGSGRPVGVAAYGLAMLAADVAALADGLGREAFTIVGHDWGGVVAWETAIRYPQRVERLVVMDAPHPDILRSVARSHPGQLLRSSYALFFQLPRLPEALLSVHDFRLLRRSMSGSSAPGTFSEEELDRYAAEWARPGALTAMLTYYRALRTKPRRDAVRVTRPTLVVWGGRDRFLSRPVYDASLDTCEAGQGLWVEGASHWVHRERPEAVNAALLRFLGGATPKKEAS